MAKPTAAGHVQQEYHTTGFAQGLGWRGPVFNFFEEGMPKPSRAFGL